MFCLVGLDSWSVLSLSRGGLFYLLSCRAGALGTTGHNRARFGGKAGRAMNRDELP